jgi:hypothetical protein
VIIRRFAVETSIPWQTGYVIVLERIVGIGHLPTVVLQHYARTPTLDFFGSWTYASFFPAPFLAGFALWFFRRTE